MAQPAPPNFKVSLRLPRQAAIGAAVRARLIVRNVGSAPFEVTLGGDYRATGFPQRVKVLVRDASGRALPALTKNNYGWVGGGFVGSTKLSPGKTVVVRFPLTSYVSFRAAGTYTVTAGHDLGWTLAPGKRLPQASARIVLTEPTADEAEALVATLFASRRQRPPPYEFGDYLRLRATLCTLRHPVYFEPLVRRARAGEAVAAKGLGQIYGLPPTEALLELLDHPKTEVAAASAGALQGRIPSLDEQGQPKPPEPWGNIHQIDPLYPECWDPKWQPRLLAAALRLLNRPDAEQTKPGRDSLVWHASAILGQAGTADSAQAVLQALQAALEKEPPPSPPFQLNTLDFPGQQQSLVHALTALRKRGWRTTGDAGNEAHLIAWLQQLADASVPKPKDGAWKASMLTWIEHGSPALRVSALLALPMPLSEPAARVLAKALETEDWLVLRTACEVAGKSKRKEFAPALVRVVEIAPEQFLRQSAHAAALACGAGPELWEAHLAGILSSESLVGAVQALIEGTLETPGSKPGGGNSGFDRGERFRIRDAWRAFLAKNRATLASGKKVRLPDAATSAALTGLRNDGRSVVQRTMADGSLWPRRGR